MTLVYIYIYIYIYDISSLRVNQLEKHDFSSFLVGWSSVWMDGEQTVRALGALNS